jgi:hypothetical protein
MLTAKQQQKLTKISSTLDNPDFHKKAPRRVVESMQQEEMELCSQSPWYPKDCLSFQGGKIIVDYVLRYDIVAEAGDLLHGEFEEMKDALAMIYRLDRKYAWMLVPDLLRHVINTGEIPEGTVG